MTPIHPAVRLENDDFLVDHELSALRAVSLSIGGIATFVGYARDRSREHHVTHLIFEAYESMALTTLQQLRDEALIKFGVLEVRIIHRLGHIASGQQIVFIGVAAQHRAPALEACAWLIDTLKQQVPIWKKEVTAEGVEWVTSHP